MSQPLWTEADIGAIIVNSWYYGFFFILEQRKRQKQGYEDP